MGILRHEEISWKTLSNFEGWVQYESNTTKSFPLPLFVHVHNYFWEILVQHPAFLFCSSETTAWWGMNWELRKKDQVWAEMGFLGKGLVLGSPWVGLVRTLKAYVCPESPDIRLWGTLPINFHFSDTLYTVHFSFLLAIESVQTVSTPVCPRHLPQSPISEHRLHSQACHLLCIHDILQSGFTSPQFSTMPKPWQIAILLHLQFQISYILKLTKYFSSILVYLFFFFFFCIRIRTCLSTSGQDKIHVCDYCNRYCKITCLLSKLNSILERPIISNSEIS